MNWLLRYGMRIVRIVAGAAILLVGIGLLVLPGPGIPLVIVGLAILAVDFVWARRLKKRLEEQAKAVVNKVCGKSSSGGPRSVVANTDSGRDGVHPSN